MILKQHLWIYVSFYAAFQHSLTAFTTESVSRVHCYKPARLPLRKSVYILWKNCVGVCELSEERVLRNQGESFLVSVPAIVLSPWKLMSVVGRQSVLSCLYWWKISHPQTDLQSTFAVDSISIETHISPTGCRTELCFARCLLYVYKLSRWIFILHITSAGKCGMKKKKTPLRKMVLSDRHSKSDSRGKMGFLTLGKNVRVTNCLYSKNGMPWLRFSSLVRSVMSVCSSAKPERMTKQ